MADDEPFHNPFGALAALRGSLPAAADPPAPSPAETPLSSTRRGPARAVVRIERSGRSGKAVTVIEHLDLPPTDRDAWLKALKASLGCGGTLEGDAIVLQGDQRPRAPALLTARGVRKITVA